MTVSNTFEELSRLLRRIESGGWSIEYVETTGGKLRADEPLTVEVGVSSPLLDMLQDETRARIEGPSVENSITVLDITIPTAERDTNLESAVEDGRTDTGDEASNDRRANGHGELRPQTTEPEDARTDSMEDATPEHDNVEESLSTTDESEESKPAHHDPERLREAYEEHDTFAEMTDALGVDVSPQTVRHFMIRHGVHEPASHSSSTKTTSPTETGADSDSSTDSQEGEREETDRSTDTDSNHDHGEDVEGSDTLDDEKRGSIDDTDTPTSDDPTGDGELEAVDEESESNPTSNANGTLDVDQLKGTELPDDVSIADVKRAVESASTVHEVRRELNLNGETTRDVLRELDLLDLVTGRLAYKPNQDKPLDQIETATGSTEEIEKRIRSALDPHTTTNRPGQAADVSGNYSLE